MVASFKAYFGINGQTGVTHFLSTVDQGFKRSLGATPQNHVRLVFA